MSNDDTPTWIQNAGTFGAGSGGWPTGPGMSHRDIERRVADTLRGATDSIAAHSNVLHTLAAHEGGHAIVARALGLPIREVSIDVDHGGVNRFHADRAPEGWTTTDDATILLAGVVAERMLHPASALEGSEDDEAALLALMAGSQPPDVVRAKATAELYLDGNRGQLDDLVDALIRRRHLTGGEVDELLGEVRSGPRGWDTDETRAHREFLDRMGARVRVGLTRRPVLRSGGRDCTHEMRAL